MHRFMGTVVATTGTTVAVTAVDAGRTVGRVLCQPSATEPHVGEIVAMLVAEDHWGQQVGDLLLDALFDAVADRFELMVVHVPAANTAAAERYRRHGWWVEEHVPPRQPGLVRLVRVTPSRQQHPGTA